MSNYIADLIVALSLLCVLVSGLFVRFRIRLQVTWTACSTFSLSASFWAAAIRIATPLMFGVLGALLCERAGVLNLGIEGIFTAGAMAGWMASTSAPGLWTGVLVAALTGAGSGSCSRCSPCRSACRSTSPASASRCSRPALAYFIYRLALPNVATPPRIAPFQSAQYPGSL